MFAAQDVRLTGLYKDMHLGGFPPFLSSKVMAIFLIWGNFPVEKLKVKMSSSSCLAHGPRALRNVGGYRLALMRLWRASGGWSHRAPSFEKQHSSFLLLSHVELGCYVLLKPPSHVLIPRNQNGTMAKDALLMEKFISAVCVR